MKKILTLLCVFFACLNVAHAQTKPTIVTSFSILADITRNITGDVFDIISIIPAGVDAHGFTPAPSDLKKIAGADVIITNGLGFDTWLNKAAAASETSAPIITITKNITPRTLGKDDHHDHDHEHHESDHRDPHVWQNPMHMQTAVDTITTALVAKFPANAKQFQTNADAYKKQLTALDAWIKSSFKNIQIGQRAVITAHNAFGYYADAYGVTFYAPHGLSSDDETTPQTLDKLIQFIKDNKITTLHPEPEIDAKLLNTLASETGAKIGLALYADALTLPNGDAPTYIAMLQHNTREIIAGFAAP